MSIKRKSTWELLLGVMPKSTTRVFFKTKQAVPIPVSRHKCIFLLLWLLTPVLLTGLLHNWMLFFSPISRGLPLHCPVIWPDYIRLSHPNSSPLSLPESPARCQEILAWARSKAEPQATEVREAEAAAKFIDDNDLVVLGFFKVPYYFGIRLSSESHSNRSVPFWMVSLALRPHTLGCFFAWSNV